MMVVLCRYKEVSGQMINKPKIYFYIHENTLLAVGVRMRRATCIKMGNFPFTYLGCPVFYGRRNVAQYGELLRKVSRRIRS